MGGSGPVTPAVPKLLVHHQFRTVQHVARMVAYRNSRSPLAFIATRRTPFFHIFSVIHHCLSTSVKANQDAKCGVVPIRRKFKKKHTHVVPMEVFLPVPLDYALANQLEMEKSMEFRSDV